MEDTAGSVSLCAKERRRPRAKENTRRAMKGAKPSTAEPRRSLKAEKYAMMRRSAKMGFKSMSAFPPQAF